MSLGYEEQIQNSASESQERNPELKSIPEGPSESLEPNLARESITGPECENDEDLDTEDEVNCESPADSLLSSLQDIQNAIESIVYPWKAETSLYRDCKAILHDVGTYLEKRSKSKEKFDRGFFVKLKSFRLIIQQYLDRVEKIYNELISVDTLFKPFRKSDFSLEEIKEIYFLRQVFHYYTNDNKTCEFFLRETLEALESIMDDSFVTELHKNQQREFLLSFANFILSQVD